MAFEKFKLSDIRAAVKRKIDDDQLDNAIIDEAANDFQFEIFNDNRIRFMEESVELTITEGDTGIDEDFPSNYMLLLNFIIYDTSTTYRNITEDEQDYEYFMERNAMFAIATPGKITEWTPFGEGVRFSRPTNADYTALIDYLRTPERMTAPSSECELPINYKEMMTLGTLERVLRIEEDYDVAFEEGERLLGLRTSFVRNYGRGSLTIKPTKIRTRRGNRHGTWRADRDF